MTVRCDVHAARRIGWVTMPPVMFRRKSSVSSSMLAVAMGSSAQQGPSPIAESIRNVAMPSSAGSN